jgi:hypothetical protein
MAMEEEKKGEAFQTPREFESRLSRPKPQSPAKKLFIIIVSIIVLGLLIFGVTRMLSGSNAPAVEEQPAPTQEAFPTDIPEPTESDVTPTQEPSKTPTPKPTVNPVDKASGLDRSKLDVHVLNGSGTAGAGKKAADILEGLGYNVIQVGNAQNFDYQTSVIQVKKASESYIALLKKDLSGYSTGSTSADLADSERPDAIVIIGKE